MAALHVVNHVAGLESCLAVAATQDTVLLIADAVRAAREPLGRPVHVLGEDVERHELTGRLAEGATPVDYQGFVELAARCQPIVSWR